MAHVRDVRLLQAAIALRTSTRSILTIALDADCEPHEGFTRAFRRRFGTTPRESRKRHRPQEEAETMQDLKPRISLVKIPVSDFAGGRGEPGGDTGIHLEVTDAAAAFALLQQRGASFAGALTESDDGGRFFEVRDPDGNTLKFCQAAG